jgi:hypothetical protein
MLGSPNFICYVYNGDASDTPDADPNGSSVIEDAFFRHYGANSPCRRWLVTDRYAMKEGALPTLAGRKVGVETSRQIPRQAKTISLIGFVN